MALKFDKVLRKNFSYLFILQIAVYIVPLLIFPYLATTLKSENFGKIMFAQAFVGYFVLFSEFGFSISATKEVADAQNNKIEISEIFWNTMLAKLFLVLISIMFFVVIVLVFKKLQSEYLTLSICFINVFSSLLLPIWLFQGLEKMGIITLVNTVPKIIMILFIFVFVKNENDYNIALIIQVLAGLLSSLLSLYLIFHYRLISFRKPSINSAKKQIKSSYHIFASSLSTNLYTTTNTVVLGLLTNNTSVGVYSAGEKLIKALISLMSSITTVIFPRVNKYFHESKQKSLNFIKKIIIIMTVVCLILVFGIYFGSDLIVNLLFKDIDFKRTIKVLEYSSFLPLLSVINGLIAINIFITFRLNKEMMKIVFIGCLFSLSLIFPLVSFFDELGPVICATLTELLILILFIVEIRKRKFF